MLQAVAGQCTIVQLHVRLLLVPERVPDAPVGIRENRLPAGGRITLLSYAHVIIMPTNPFKRTEIDPKILELIKDPGAMRQYLLQVFLLRLIERLTFAFLVATVPTLLSLIPGE